MEHLGATTDCRTFAYELCSAKKKNVSPIISWLVNLSSLANIMIISSKKKKIQREKKNEKTHIEYKMEWDNVNEWKDEQRNRQSHNRRVDVGLVLDQAPED